MEELDTFIIISGRIILRMRNVSGKSVEKIKTHILRSINFCPENRTVFTMMGKSIVQKNRPQMIL
jgi:hypothetical protein